MTFFWLNGNFFCCTDFLPIYLINLLDNSNKIMTYYKKLVELDFRQNVSSISFSNVSRFIVVMFAQLIKSRRSFFDIDIWPCSSLESSPI